MAEEKMVSIEKMDEIIKDYFPQEETVDFHGQELVIRHLVPYATETEIINSVIEACFDAENGRYMPDVLDFALKSCFVAVYTNVRLPQDVEHRMRIIYGTNLMSYIYHVISEQQRRAIEDAINAGISVRNNANTVLFEKQVSDITDMITETAKRFSGIFEDLTPGDMKALVGAISNGGIDEEKLVQAVVAEQAKQRDGSVIPFPAEEDRQE